MSEESQTETPSLDGFSWSRIHQRRREMAARFGTIFSLPIVKRVRDVVLESVEEGSCVLDVGGGDRRVERMLNERGRAVIYASYDHDPEVTCDYSSFDEIEEVFDAVLLLEVVEHLEFEVARGWFTEIARRLRDGGRLVVSTPNTYAPTAFLQDATHKTPFCYDQLAALVAESGFEVERIVRIHHGPVWRAFVRRWLFGWLFRLQGVDFARQIALVARREPAGQNLSDGSP